MREHIAAFVAGAVFSAGLVLSGMTQPAKVVGFLDFFGNWDPSLAFVMAGGILVHFVGYRLVMKRGRSMLGSRLLIPTRTDVDPPLVLGAAIFGAGWGLAGYCPGPGLVSLGAGGSTAAVFVGAMVLGMGLHHVTFVRRVFHAMFQPHPRQT